MSTSGAGISGQISAAPSAGCGHEGAHKGNWSAIASPPEPKARVSARSRSVRSMPSSSSRMRRRGLPPPAPAPSLRAMLLIDLSSAVRTASGRALARSIGNGAPAASVRSSIGRCFVRSVSRWAPVSCAPSEPSRASTRSSPSTYWRLRAESVPLVPPELSITTVGCPSTVSTTNSASTVRPPTCDIRRSPRSRRPLMRR